MSNVLEKELTCPACGVDVRAETQYCYECGESLGIVPSDVDAEDNRSHPPELNISSKDSAAVTSEGELPRLETAATLRRKSRGMKRKPVEVVWEPSGTGANIVLIVATVLLLAFTAGVVFLALSYK